MAAQQQFTIGYNEPQIRIKEDALGILVSQMYNYRGAQ